MCDGTEGPLAGWTYRSDLMIPNFPPKPDNYKEISGFEYGVWVENGNRPKPLVVIAFRGSDFEGGDWFSNLRWITRFIPLTWDHYDQTRDLIPRLEQSIRDNFTEEVEIVTTGHSLGGGLAQQAAYISKNIKTVYAFDSSTVTGYYSVAGEIRNESEKGMHAFRVYEHGEILAYLRLFMKFLYPIANQNPKIVEVRYNLTTGNFVSQHNMKEFACNLKSISDGIQ